MIRGRNYMATERNKPKTSTCRVCKAVIENAEGRGAPKKYCTIDADRVAALQAKCGAAKQRADKSKGRISYALDSDAIVQLALQQNWKCAVTGIAFDTSATEAHASPWAASIDRLDSTRGYVLENVRLVVHAYNLVKNEWSDDKAKEIVRRLADSIPRPTEGEACS